jgi:hypothetical protein
VQRVCVFCGSSPGARPAYAEVARELAAELVSRDLELVYGGGDVGLMGIVANAVLERGGHVIGVIPEALVAKEVAHQQLPDLRIVDSMHTRKALMADLADAFVALPGGIGTLEECFEVLTWAQLGMHAKPCALLDVERYYAPLVAFLEHTVDERFLRREHLDMLLVRDTPGGVLDACASYLAPPTEKWIDRDER